MNRKSSHSAVQKTVQDGSDPAQSTRDIDPNVLQAIASSPESSVWVGASAGSGKTKVLTDRVLRLLLPRPDGRKGTPAHKILCITFTKAAASEMALRITRMLSKWAVMPQEELIKDLGKLLGHAPKPDEIKAARQLFAEVADAPGGLQIMTIHSFCQSVLGRFPLEAGLPLRFTVLEERQAQIMLTQAGDTVLSMTQKTGHVADAINRSAGVVNEDDFFELIANLGKERYQLQKLLQENFSTADGLYAALCNALDIRQNQSSEDIILEACKDSAFDVKNLRALKDSALADWLAASPETRAANFKNYADIYLTQKGEIRKKLKDETLLAEAERLLAVQDSANTAKCALHTRDLMVLGQAILDEYQRLKLGRGALDFDDLIIYTLKLLQQDQMAAWVLYKLDQGLDHVLVDEAQDTNPEQWDITLALVHEFFAGLGARDDIDRTTFTVGDRKQSIYSFQRASPKKFAAAKEQLQNLVESAEKNWEDVPINISFRSTPSVLAAVDATFAAPELNASLGDGAVQHIPWQERKRQAGRVELWPLYETPEGKELDPWDPPISVIEHSSGAAKLADDIAKEIKGWLDKGEQLPSRGRSIRPEDILILVRTRGAFVSQLARALKKQNVPVSGVDRMILNDQLAVQDMLALAQFALLPTDDLTLATILKSPLIGWNDDKLYALATDRPDKAYLWDMLQSGTPEKSYLQSLIDMSGSLHPYEFFSSVLQRACPADGISGLHGFKARLGADSLDPLDELLNTALNYERDNIASLQGFLNWQAHETGAIKRDMDEARSEVRIMTVHGSKGLQAPIVILPDTIRYAGGGGKHTDRRLLWPDKSGLPVPFWCPNAQMQPQAFADAKARYDEQQAQESHRLLYVAMTRAEDRLYVAGYQGKKNAAPDSWYFAIKNGLESLADTETLKDGRLRLENSQIGDPDKSHKETPGQKQATEAPAWLRQQAPAEPSPPRPLVPSRPSQAEAPVLSPLTNEATQRFRRGNLTHKLLQYLPELPESQRAEAAKNYIAHYGHDLTDSIRASIVTETLAVLAHPQFAKIFGNGSQAEVPITGLVGEHVVSGQIDRLLVTESEILIIDYKTNRPPPTDPKDVPVIYFDQLRAYADVLKAIYPGRTVQCALLWTDGTRLMPLKV